MSQNVSTAAKELIDKTQNLQISDIEGSGEGGKVIKTDVEDIIEKGYVERQWSGQTKYVEVGGTFETLDEQKIKQRV